MKDELYDVVEKTIDYVFEGRYMLNMYEYLKSSKVSRTVVDEFLMSCTATEVKNLVLDLEGYLEGGNDDIHKQLREGYGHIPKPRARKIRNYLYGILEDAWRYERDKRPGRKKRS